MGFLDKVKAQAEQTLKQGQDKLDEVQAKKKADGLLRDLGAWHYAVETGRDDGQGATEIARIVSELHAHEAEHGPLGGRTDDEPAEGAPSGSPPPPTGPPAGPPAGPAFDPALAPPATPPGPADGTVPPPPGLSTAPGVAPGPPPGPAYDPALAPPPAPPSAPADGPSWDAPVTPAPPADPLV